MVLVDPKYTTRTSRLLLRPLTLEDAADIVLMRQDAEVMKHTSILPSPSLATTHAWITGCHALPNNWNFAIELLPTPSSTSTSPRVIGLIGAVRAPEIGYMLNYTYWGKGYATEALQAFLPLFFGHYQEAEYAEALTDPELASSRNVLRKAGFVVVEERKGDFENPVLGVRDTVVWRIGRGEVMG